MRKFIALVMMLVVTFSVTQSVYAQSVTAANIFSTMGGTATISQGDAIHTQARDIYSMGGGEVSFTGQNVSLLSVNPPSFEAGCSGISWFFGGFDFISLQQIEQLVESIAQASLGIVVDLAMQTLCPQCYAVMAKLRDIANEMRNASANACGIATELGRALQNEGIFNPSTVQSNCSQSSAASGSSDSFLGGLLGSCGTLSQSLSGVSSDMSSAMSWLNGTGYTNGSTPSKNLLDQVGNYTYEELTALGYPDGPMKDVMLSVLGMAVVYPMPSSDCATAMANFYGSSTLAAYTSVSTNVQANLINPAVNTGLTSSYTSAVSQYMSSNASSVSSLFGSGTTSTASLFTSGVSNAISATGSSSTSPTFAMANPQTATPTSSGATQGMLNCYAPPLLTNVNQLAQVLVCGWGGNDAATFNSKWGSIAGNAGTNMLTQMCSNGSMNGTLSGQSLSSADPTIYQCTAAGTSRCMQPNMTTLSADMNTSGASSQYTGLGWMVLDALYAGVYAAETNTQWPAQTIAIVNGSGYPLYRLINMAAVYPGTATELLNAYAAIISVQYATTVLQKLMAPGAVPTTDPSASKGGMSRTEMAQLRGQINEMLDGLGSQVKDQLGSLAAKKALVDQIVQVNRDLQAEVLSQGLGQNARLALSIKQQIAAQGTQPATTTSPQ
jgi:hypothetical protein